MCARLKDINVLPTHQCISSSLTNHVSSFSRQSFSYLCHTPKNAVPPSGCLRRAYSPEVPCICSTVTWPPFCYRMFFFHHAFRPPHGPERLRGSYDTSNDRVQGVVSSRAGVNRTSAELSAQQGVCVPVAGTIVHNGREELPDLVRSALFGAATACRDLPAKRRSCCRLA